MEWGGRKILKDKTKKLGGNQIVEALGCGFSGIQNAEKAPEKVKKIIQEDIEKYIVILFVFYFLSFYFPISVYMYYNIY